MNKQVFANLFFCLLLCICIFNVNGVSIKQKHQPQSPPKETETENEDFTVLVCPRNKNGSLLYHKTDCYEMGEFLEKEIDKQVHHPPQNKTQHQPQNKPNKVKPLKHSSNATTKTKINKPPHFKRSKPKLNATMKKQIKQSKQMKDIYEIETFEQDLHSLIEELLYNMIMQLTDESIEDVNYYYYEDRTKSPNVKHWEYILKNDNTPLLQPKQKTNPTTPIKKNNKLKQPIHHNNNKYNKLFTLPYSLFVQYDSKQRPTITARLTTQIDNNNYPKLLDNPGDIYVQTPFVAVPEDEDIIDDKEYKYEVPEEELQNQLVIAFEDNEE
jgi:hypothetical protein